MANGLALAELVDVGLDFFGGEVEVVVQEAQHAEGWGERAFGSVAYSEELDAVAGGEDESFANAGLMGEGAGGVGQARDGDGEALADVDGSGGVVDAEEQDRAGFEGDLAHGALNLCTAERAFADQTARTTRKTKLER